MVPIMWLSDTSLRGWGTLDKLTPTPGWTESRGAYWKLKPSTKNPRKRMPMMDVNKNMRYAHFFSQNYSSDGYDLPFWWRSDQQCSCTVKNTFRRFSHNSCPQIWVTGWASHVLVMPIQTGNPVFKTLTSGLPSPGFGRVGGLVPLRQRD